MEETTIWNEDDIAARIFYIRGHKVMLDADLAIIYGVETRRLNEQVKRNIGRFPEDFMFQLTEEEYQNLMSQIATSSGWGGRRKAPFVFTEHGAVMLASVLNSPTAIQASLFVVRAFVKLRQMLESYRELENKLAEIEAQTQSQFKEQQNQIQIIFETIKKLIHQEKQPRPKIGFKTKEND